jgi:hypothetical protein
MHTVTRKLSVSLCVFVRRFIQGFDDAAFRPSALTRKMPMPPMPSSGGDDVLVLLGMKAMSAASRVTSVRPDELRKLHDGGDFSGGRAVRAALNLGLVALGLLQQVGAVVAFHKGGSLAHDDVTSFSGCGPLVRILLLGGEPVQRIASKNDNIARRRSPAPCHT